MIDEEIYNALKEYDNTRKMVVKIGEIVDITSHQVREMKRQQAIHRVVLYAIIIATIIYVIART